MELTLIQICQITNPVTSAPENPPLQKITPAPNAGQTVSPTTQTPNTTTSQQTAGTTSGVTQTAEPQAAYRAATIRPTTFKRDIPAAPTQTRKAAPPTRISIHQKPGRICRRGKHIDRTNRTRYTIHSRSPYHSLAGIRQNHTDRSRARQYDAELPPTARRPQEFRSVGRFPNSSGPHQRAFPRIDVFPTKYLEEQPVLHAITYQPTGREGNYFQSERCTDEDDRKESRYKKPVRYV